jgi:Ni,Fe-hydrogenase III small subunit
MRGQLKAYVFNVGSCNGCDIEVLAWSIEYETTLVDDPCMADIYIVTGSLTAANAERLKALSQRLPKRPVILIGTCAISQCLFLPAAEDLNQFTFFDPDRRTLVYGCPPAPCEIAACRH